MAEDNKKKAKAKDKEKSTKKSTKKESKKPAKKKQAQEESAALAVAPFVRWLLRMGALVLIFWLVLIPLLAIVWGSSVPDISKIIQDQIAFFEAHGINWSKSLDMVANAGWSERFGVGVIMGFMYFNLKFAMLLAFFESTALCFSSMVLRMVVRMVMLGTLLVFKYEDIYGYTGSFAVTVYAFAVFFLVSTLIGTGIKKLEEKSERQRLSYRLLAFVLVLIVFSPILTHPAWNLFINAEKYNAGNHLTQVRDWFLLNQDGESWINDWYYQYAAVGSESERITAFQPMVAGIIDVDLKRWNNILHVKFSRGRGSFGTRLKYVRFQSLEEGLEALKKKQLHVLLCNSKHYKDDSQIYEGIEKDAFVVLHNVRERSQTKEGFPVRSQTNFYQRIELENGGHDYVTPLTKRKETLLKRSWFPERKEIYIKYNRFFYNFILPLDKTKSHSVFPWAFVFVMSLVLLGAIYYVVQAIVFLTQISKGIFLLVFCLPLIWGIPALSTQFKWWNEMLDEDLKEKTVVELKQLELHLMSLQPNDELTKKILSEPMSEDSRLAMWQIEYFGEAYIRTRDGKLKQSIRVWLKDVLEDYPNRPVNFRYKMVRTFALIREFHPRLEEWIAQEDNLYVRFYAEDRGFGREKFLGSQQTRMMGKDLWSDKESPELELKNL